MLPISLPDFNAAKVLVVGDVMLDRYWRGETSRISPEAPVPVVHIQDRHDRPGAAANVALNIAAVGARTGLLGVVGEDARADLLHLQLGKAQIEAHLCRVKGYSTIAKLRVLSKDQQLLRLDFEESAIPMDVNAVFRDYVGLLEQYNVVVLSDYGKGTLKDVRRMISEANKRQIKTLVDPKGEDFSKYKGASLITPNLKEFTTIVGHCDSLGDIVEKGIKMRADLELEALLVTRGKDGMTLIPREGEVQHLNAYAHEVYDVTGAGDTVIALFAAALSVKTSFSDAMRIANLGAGIVVTKLGASIVTVPELRQKLQQEQKTGFGIIDEKNMLTMIQDAQDQKEKVVFTNGCFDLLHAGHVMYLEQARALGHRLVVAVNDDNSVRKLKGTQRPLVPLADRMAVLAGLKCVDWVVPFSEDTPERLIRYLNPDVLVKGGDYKISDIAGASFVLEKGGEVKVLGFKEGISTTQLIEKIRGSTL